MSADTYMILVRVSWLVLCGMMLFSRFVFQALGAPWMRSFLDTWKDSRTHRLWGWAAFLVGIVVLVNLPATWNRLGGIDRGAAAVLVVVLCADGLLNLFPAWFGHFKEKMQDSWVKRHAGTERTSDEHLFGTVNFALGAAAATTAAAVYLYRPLATIWLIVSIVLAAAIMTALIMASQREGKSQQATK